MATSRLTFLYPHLFRSGGRWTDSATSTVLRRPRRKPSPLLPSPVCCRHVAPFTSPSDSRQATFAKRAGKGIEPLQVPSDADKSQSKSEDGRQEGGGGIAQGSQGHGQGRERDAASSLPQTATEQPTSSPPSSSPRREGMHTQASPPRPDLPKTIELPPPADIDPVTQAKKGSPMDEILHMGPPPDSLSAPSIAAAAASVQPGDSTRNRTSGSSSSSSNTASTGGSTGTRSPDAADASRTPAKPPHLTPAPYIHHFDSYTLVKQLTAGGYTQAQAILAMKAIRTLLAANLDAAQAGLVSKADVENETYLFRAACSELSAEVRNNRRVADEQLRQQRTLLQHEVDILAHRLNQELLTLNDSVRGMFNDRRMAVREEQKAVESRIQQINYKISVALNSDAKSDIEGLRWVLIRRSVLGIIFMALLTLSTIRYTTYMARKRKEEAEQRAKAEEDLRKHDGRSDHLAGPVAVEVLAAS